MATILYTVRPGDTLSSIANRFDTTVNDIARYNGIVDVDNILAGQTIRIFVPSESRPSWYIVRRGDTLWSIAEKFNTTVDELAQLNNIRNPNVIYAGRIIRIRP